jgi:hypothetical protein
MIIIAYKVDHIDHGSIPSHKHQKSDLRDVGLFKMAWFELEGYAMSALEYQ